MSWDNSTTAWDSNPAPGGGVSDWNAGASGEPDWNAGGEDEFAQNSGDLDLGTSGGESFSGFDMPVDETPQEEGCRRCKKPGHIAKNCTEPRVCFNCGEEGHNKLDCPNPRKPRGPCRHCQAEGHQAADCPDKPARPCFNCGEEGHNKIDCPKPRVFKGTCRHCGKEGHPASECPDKPCLNCGQLGHHKDDCSNPTVEYRGKCPHCKKEGHRLNDCPDKPEGGFPCFNCGEMGHSSKECQQPKVFRGTCRICSAEGHQSADCPDKPPMQCRNCNELGHSAAACTQPRKLHELPEDQPIPDPDQSWAAMIQADKEGDLEDFRKAMMDYSRAFPDLTFAELEQALRSHTPYTFRVHLIALETTVIGNKTLVNLQGKDNQKYVIKLQMGAKPKRTMMVCNIQAHDWEENLKRLDEAGFMMDSFQPYCFNCKQNGHIAKACPEEKKAREEKVDQTVLRERPERGATTETPWMV